MYEYRYQVQSVKIKATSYSYVRASGSSQVQNVSLKQETIEKTVLIYERTYVGVLKPSQSKIDRRVGRQGRESSFN